MLKPLGSVGVVNFQNVFQKNFVVPKKARFLKFSWLGNGFGGRIIFKYFKQKLYKNNKIVSFIPHANFKNWYWRIGTCLKIIIMLF